LILQQLPSNGTVINGLILFSKELHKTKLSCRRVNYFFSFLLFRNQISFCYLICLFKLFKVILISK
jgi:hypothetical protein